MKISLLTMTLLCTLIISTKGQTVVIEYAQKANIENQLKGVTDPAIRARVTKHLSKEKLYLFVANKGESSYKKINEVVIDDIAAYAEENNLMTIGGLKGSAYKNQKENLFLKNSNILSKDYLIKDEIAKIDWTITDEHKVIGKYKCRKATANYYSTEITAWYTDQIALNNGPDEFGNLPGMILELATDKKTITAKKILIKKDSKDLKFERPDKGKKIKLKEYHLKLNEIKKKIKSNRDKKELKIKG